MKKLIAIMLLVLTGALAATAENFDDKWKRYGNTYGIATSYITRDMLSMASGMKVDAGKLDLKAAPEGVDDISIASSTTRIAADRLRSDANSMFLNSKKYSIIMKVQDRGEQTTILSRKLKKNKMEYVVLSDKDKQGEYSIAVIRGSMAPNDVTRMIRK